MLGESGVQWGVMLTTANPPHTSERDVLTSAVANAKLAEAVGYQSVWLLEHHFTPYGLCPDTISFAGFILGATERLHVGTAVVVAPLTHPLRIAENTAMLDQISNGRFHLGLGRGGFPRDFSVFGIDPSKSHDLLRESVDVIKGAWTQETVAGAGEHYKFQNVPVYPKPLTKPHPPIYIAGESSSTVEWAATKAIPLLIMSGLDDEETRTRMELYNEFAEMAGHDPSTIPHVLSCIGYIADTQRAAQERIVDDLQWWTDEASAVGFTVDELKKLPNYSYHLRRMEQNVMSGGDYTIRRWLDSNPVGPVEFCIERLEALIANSGAHHIVLGVEGAGSPALVAENIERFATEVIPKVRVPQHDSA